MPTATPDRRPVAPVCLLAAVWGFAEATLFFLVPDLLLGFVSLNSRRLAVSACAWVVAGALAGGAVMYSWGAREPARAAAVLDRIPAVSDVMLTRVAQSMQKQGMRAVFVGAFSGKPYKIYAVEAGRQGLSPMLFLLISIPARLARFLLVVLFVYWLSNGAARAWPLARKRLVLSLFWIVFYGAFFAMMPN